MNKKGVTMISLIFYILSFFVVVSVIGTIGIYVTKNMDSMNFETNPNHAQNQVDKYLRKFFARKDQYEIIDEYNNDSQYIKFTRTGSNNETNIVRYYPQSLLIGDGLIFLETRKNENLVKKLLIAENVVGLKFYESETGLGKFVEVELNILKGDETIELVSTYGVER